MQEEKKLEVRYPETTVFDWFLQSPGKVALKTILGEVEKLQWIRAIELDRLAQGAAARVQVDVHRITVTRIRA